MLFFVEAVMPERASIGVGLVVILVIDTLEGVRVWFALFGFKMRGVGLKISLAAPGGVLVVFGFVWAIALQAFCILNVVTKDSVTPLLAVFALGDTGVHVGVFDGSNESANIEVLVNEFLCHQTIL